MAHYNPSQKNPPWVRNNVQQQQPLLAQQMTVQSVALSQPALTTTHLAAQNQLGQVQITPAIQGQVQLPVQTHLLLNHQQLAPATFGQVQINQAQLANISTSQHQATTHQTYFTPSISLQQNVGVPHGTIQIQPSGLVIPTTMSTSIAPPGLAMPTSLATVHNTSGMTYTLNRMASTLPQQQQQQCQQQQPQQQQPTVKQRVFSGTVTKLHENFGFIDDDVIFQASAVKGTCPQVGDRVLVEASYNGAMPFKWNAQRVQVIAPSQQSTQKLSASFNSSDAGKPQSNRDYVLRGRPSNDYRDSDRSTPKSRDSRTRRSSRSTSRSPSRKRSRSPPGSPPRRRTKAAPRYSVQIPKVSLDCREANVVDLRRRYNHLYVPSDVVSSINWWTSSFPSTRPFPLDKPVSFHIFDKDVDPPEENLAVYEPSDADYSFSAKVMLLSLPSLEEMQRRCCSEEDDFVHPARLIRFLVGNRGSKNETMAIGGPWSPSLDGENPKSDPQVLIRTAIRTCKALTGIDLSGCTQWFRIAEIRYQRVSSGKSHVESVILYLPDIWSCVPTANQWENIVLSYIRPIQQPADDEDATLTEAKMEDDQIKEMEITEACREATHHSKLDPRSLKIGELRAELEARNLCSKGFRTQLIPRLIIALKAEAQEEKKKQEDALHPSEAEHPVPSREPSPNVPVAIAAADEDPRRVDFAASPQILVHPSRTAKGGKFSCSLVSLSVLLDYRVEDTKEHTFEVSLFSELFNEMLMRDFGKLVYRSILNDSLKNEKKEKCSPCSSRLLLLAYCYFDLTHCNYITIRDLEDLFLTLGMQLSRAQVRKLLQKVVTDDMLRYRKLIERAGSPMKDEDESEQIAQSIKEDNLEVSAGVVTNDLLGSQEKDQAVANGCYVNVDQLLLRLEQSEACRRQTELQFRSAQNQLVECRAELSKATSTIASLCEQLDGAKSQSASTSAQLTQVQDCFHQFIDGVNKIQVISSNLLQISTPLVKVKEETNSNVELCEKVD